MSKIFVLCEADDLPTHLELSDVKGFEPLLSAFTVTSVYYLRLLPIHSLPSINNLKKVEDIGVEPMTPCVQGRCSSQLS
jgi:hypothetical protein